MMARLAILWSVVTLGIIVAMSGCAAFRAPHMRHNSVDLEPCVSPMPVAFAPSVGPAGVEAVRYAMGFWAAMRDRPVFVEGHGGVTVEPGGDLDGHTTFDTASRCLGRVTVSLPVNFERLPIEMRDAIAKHELGHTLGLDDILSSGFVMSRKLVTP